LYNYLQVGYWVATEIVQAKSLKEQLKIVKKFIQVAAGTASIPHTTAVKELTRPFFGRALECLALSNFNSFMEILSGLNNSSVQRLKNLWEVCRHCFLRCTFELLTLALHRPAELVHQVRNEVFRAGGHDGHQAELQAVPTGAQLEASSRFPLLRYEGYAGAMIFVFAHRHV
jgi:hypothetical protein